MLTDCHVLKEEGTHRFVMLTPVKLWQIYIP